MNLFYLDDDLDKCAEYHIDDHVSKMQLEGAQLLCTVLWVDKLFGYVPRPLTSEEFQELKAAMKAEPTLIADRTFVPYKASHHNHPSQVWLRSSLEHFYWGCNYVNALQSEAMYRGRNPHKSCAVVNGLPEPKNLKDTGFVRPYQAMPEELKSTDVLQDYRLFYQLDKAPFAKWTRRDKPDWWDEDIAMYDKRYTALTPAERRATGFL